jgi:hypothetical protein
MRRFYVLAGQAALGSVVVRQAGRPTGHATFEFNIRTVRGHMAEGVESNAMSDDNPITGFAPAQPGRGATGCNLWINLLLRPCA